MISKTLIFSEIREAYPVICIGCFEQDKDLARRVSFIGEEAVKLAKRLSEEKIFSGKKRECFSSLLEASKLAKGLVLIGLGKREKWDTRTLRESAAHLVPEIKRLRARKAAVLLSGFADKKLSSEQTAQALEESLALSGYKFDRYRVKKNGEENSKVALEEVDLLIERAGEKVQAERGASSGAVIAEAVNFARDLGNEPANVMTPSRIAEEARKVAQENDLKCEILDEPEIRKLKMGGILGVAQGSHEPPHLIILERRVRNPKKTICLVGKGITFDTGGISLKPAKDMEKMKYDMMGAAAVIAILKAVSRLKLPFHIIGIAPVCENLPSQKPQRPGDIVIAYNKKSVEVVNTDAEGRLILMDALAYTEKFKPDAIIDLATLTGQCAATFGDKCIGLMGNDRRLLDRILRAGTESGERCWELPLWDDYLDLIKGDITDLKNVGPGFGGTITAGKFLEQFVPKGIPWAHLDIASVAWADSAKPNTPKGPTGAGVRLITQLLRDWK